MAESRAQKPTRMNATRRLASAMSPSHQGRNMPVPACADPRERVRSRDTMNAARKKLAALTRMPATREPGRRAGPVEDLDGQHDRVGPAADGVDEERDRQQPEVSLAQRVPVAPALRLAHPATPRGCATRWRAPVSNRAAVSTPRTDP